MGSDVPRTEAGRILLREHSSGTPHMARHIRAIEAEAAASPSSDPDLRAALTERIGAVIDRWYHLGLLRFSSRDDGGDDLLLRDELVRAALSASQTDGGSDGPA